MIIKVWLFIMILTVLSWLGLKAVRKPMHIGWVFLFWVVTILGGTAFFYMISVWFVSNQ
ncbi:hypothetical protein P8629_02505 [Hydrogenovibrio sp. 3SP14C1]|uniref:hypothetical protein n=1 Tax=Hydrogenovibrio sp. 3SP14C1 TaxID=3038774 RepID=UPI002417079F|nr:hypothetical protein [Hydrogenovibrio sp. 3SP14C1]MDG4811867.1 hypothetical protein [Hydrogenovibrio sp. 3SP14C1]